MNVYDIDLADSISWYSVLEELLFETFGPEVFGDLDFGRDLGICLDLEGSDRIGPAHEFFEVFRHLRVYRRDLAFENLAAHSLDGYPVSFLDGDITGLDVLRRTGGWDLLRWTEPVTSP